MTSATPRDLADRLERNPPIPNGSAERFNGYGIMGLPFASGHVLAMRRFRVTWMETHQLDVQVGDGEVSWTVLLSSSRAPNGQRFVANAYLLWLVQDSRAQVRGEDLGAVGPLSVQAHLGDFWIPQRGVFAFGRAYVEPFDADTHDPAVIAGRR